MSVDRRGISAKVQTGPGQWVAHGNDRSAQQVKIRVVQFINRLENDFKGFPGMLKFHPIATDI